MPDYNVPLTDDPDEDSYPHYHGGLNVGGHIWSTLVHSDDVPIGDAGTLGIGPRGGMVCFDIEASDEDTSMGMSVELDPDTARKAARSILNSIVWAGKHREEGAQDA